MILKDAKVLFIAPEFYQYHLYIKQKMEEYGGVVDYFHEPKTSLLLSILSRISFSMMRAYLDLFYQIKYIKFRKNKYDILFVIKGYGLTESFIKKIKKNNSRMTCIMYQWDSLKNHSYVSIINEFNRVFTFDFKDVEFNQNLSYQPLFYLQKDNFPQYEQKYEILYVASFTEERYKWLKLITEYATSNKIEIKHYIYIKPKLLIKYYLKRKKLDNLKFRKLSYIKYLEYLENSKIILDIPDREQSGLSMRVIESIGAKKEIISTNPAILKYIQGEKYSEGIVEELKKLSNNMLYHIKPDEISRDDFSINSWIEKIFS